MCDCVFIISGVKIGSVAVAVFAELRSEAVMQALAQNSKQPLIMPMSSKRTSAVVGPGRGHRANRASG